MFLNLLKNNTEALELLDWFQIVNDLASLSHFDLTKKNLFSPPHFQQSELIQNKLDQLHFTLENYDEMSFIFNTFIRLIPGNDLGPGQGFDSVPFLQKERFFDCAELNFFALLFSGYKDSLRHFSEIPFSRELALESSTIDQIRKNFLTPLRHFVEPSGKISYERHPVLKNLYTKLLNIEQDLRTSILKISHSEPYQSRLQLETFDIIHDKYVLAIRSDSYQASLGSIISRSQSGMTLFVEPFLLREKSNQRLVLQAEIEAIINDLTINLSKVIHHFANQFIIISDAVIFYDSLFTKATYSLKKRLTKPVLTDQYCFELIGFFHPLIDRPICNDFDLKINQHGLILSGPNTGGKTVALKSLCLSMLFLNMGLYIPAEKATLFPVDGLFYFSHDHQNISQGLSSFSAEAKYYLSLLGELSKFNLIFIDEIFNSTSSEEASALAMALINEIHAISSSKLIISTHHQMLKTFMHHRQDYISAHVGFDLEQGQPTFKILYGEPGNSLALTIFNNLAEQFFTKTNITSVAQDHLDKKSLSYETLLLELSQKKIELDKLISIQKQLEIDLKNQRASMEGILFLEKEKELFNFNKKLNSIFDEAENLITSIKENKISSKNTLFNKAAAISREIPTPKPIKAPNNPYSHLKQIPFEEIKIGDTLFSLDFKKNVKVLIVNQRKKEVQIQQGALSSWTTANKLCYPSGKASPRVHVTIEKTSRHDIEIDCRGMRLNDFQNTCELSINELLTGEIPFLTIIHGHGDGILKNWLRKYLKDSHRNLKWENIEGNDGCTKISFN